ncbi:DNA cytosine methyltransferase [Candidatus Phytoplasma australiense]|uniref:DNA (cytosine-5-)-methyltransferase n=2 Tax=Phytoplasma australiense TaxID=59748 RepID=R4RPV0_PHYAS|nr:DNA cytosine methyltransferase [Candidatus Phytoplasma australiense]AGL90087.1 Modification methylase XorII [Strawberry lethal yellows phytoplasma (CPA) str. NZSb11]AGL90491.1 Modification methylase XorII [Strawberry lethal yellows phytoplasma (CPA) str. NZSb11]
MNKNTIAETFAGAGGSHLGFINNGFVSVYINEFEPNCIQTLKLNFPLLEKKCYIDPRDINDISINKISIINVDVLFGGIVCKGFSLAGQRKPTDKRNYLYLKQLEFVNHLKPTISIIENVPTFLTTKILKKELIPQFEKEIDDIWQEYAQLQAKKGSKRKKNLSHELENKRLLELKNLKNDLLKKLEKQQVLISVFDDIKNKYDKMGYKVYHQVLNSAWYGAATARNRAIIVAVKKEIKKIFTFPKITHFQKDNPLGNINGMSFCDNLLPYTTVEDVFKTIDYNNLDDLDNIPMSHNPKTIKRFGFIPEGKNISHIIDQLPNELKISSFYSRGSATRLSRHKPCGTLVPGHSALPIHPWLNRSITIREAAALSGFPLNYKFYGSHSNRCEQIGNAVPILLSNAIAKKIKKFLKEVKSE